VAIANQVIYDNFVQTYGAQGTTYKHTAMVRHKGTVIAFAMDQSRQIYYTVLDLENRDIKSTLDKDFWAIEQGGPHLLKFSNEIAEVGFGVADQTTLPIILKDSKGEPKAGQRVPEEKRDPFLSTTARFTADAPFQVLSDNQHVYVFRQAIDRNHEHRVWKLDRNGQPIQDQAGNNVPLVDSTLLVDRFILSGTKLMSKLEVRFQRSRSKTRPQSRKDSLGTKDLEDNWFYEPTQELRFIRNLKGGQFAVVLLPTQVAGLQRWQIFAYNSKTEHVDAYNVERSKDGLFNTRGSHIYTCEDHPEVYSLLYGKCALPSLGDASQNCDKPLVAIAQKNGYAESCLNFKAPNAHIELTKALVTPATFTLETWIQSQASTDTQGLLTTHDNPTKDTPLSVWIVRGTRLQIGLGNGQAWTEFVTPSILKLGEWNHVAMAFDGIPTGTSCRVYVNGRLRHKSDALNGKTPTQTPIRLIGDSTNSFQGSIDEIRLWDRALPPDSIRESFHQRLTGQEPGLVAYWRFDEAQGNQIYDQTDNRYNGTLTDGAWLPNSDAPIGEAPGISRNRFRIEGRNISSGLTALLYYQQLDAAKSGALNPVAGHESDDPQMPFKQSARLMLAFATQSTEAAATGKPEIATLDFGVAATGRLALAPDVLSLQRTESKTASSQEDINTQLEVVQTLEELIQSTQQEIVNLEKEKNEYTQAIAYADALPKFLVRGLTPNPTPLMPSISNLALKERLEALQLEWDRMQQAGNEYVDRCSPLEKADVGFYEHPAYTGAVHSVAIRPTTPYKDLSDAGDDLSGRHLFADGAVSKTVISYEVLQGLGLDDKISSVKTSNESKVIGKTKDGKDITTNIFEITLYQDPNLKGREFPGIFTNIPNLTDYTYDIDFFTEGKWKDTKGNWDNKVSSILLKETEEYANYRIEAEYQYLTKKKQFLAAQETELKSLRATLNAINSPQTQLDGLKTQLATKKDVLKEGGLLVPMPLVHIDPMGLTVAGAILGFAWTKSAPVLFDSAMGKLALYFQGLDDQFFVAYYRTLTQRANYTFPVTGTPSLTFYSRSLEPEFDDLDITISGDDSTTCTITIVLDNPKKEASIPTFSLTETWRNIPRIPQKIAQILNGQASKREFIGVGQLIIEEGRIQALQVTEASDWLGSSDSTHWLPTKNIDEFVSLNELAGNEQFKISRIERQTLPAGTSLKIGDTSLQVTQEVIVTFNRDEQGAHGSIVPQLPITIPVATSSLTLPDQVLPVFFLEYDYAANASTTASPSDLENGSMLVAVIAEVGKTQAIANATRTNAATLACQWVAAAPGSTLTFDGKSTHTLAKLDQLKNFRVERDLTVEAWVRPNRMGETAAILSSKLGSTSYQFGLQKKSGMSAFRAADADAFSSIVLDGAFTLECWFYIQPGRQSIKTLNILFHGMQTPIEELSNSCVVGLEWSKETGAADLILTTTSESTTATLEPKDKRPGLSINRWYHLAVTFDGKVYRSYVSGQLYSQLAVRTGSNIPKTQLTGLGPRLNTPAYNRLPAGIAHFGNSPQLFSGVVDHVRIWRGARSLDTIRANMFLRLNGNEADLELYLTCEDRVLIDLSRYQRLRKPLLPTSIFSSVLPSYAVYFGVDRQWVQTKTTLPARNWGHIAAVFNQSFAVQFDGQSGYLNCKDSSAMLNITSDLTLEVFLQVDQLGNQYGLLCKGKLTDDTDQAVPYALTIRTDGKLEFSFEALVRENSETVKIEHVKFPSSAALIAGQFYHIAITRKRVTGNQSSQAGSVQSLNQWDVIQLYINHQKDAEHRYPSTDNRPGGYLVGEGIGSSNQPLAMGCLTTGDRQNSFFQGAIAEVRIWTVARTVEQIGTTPDGREKGLVGWWRFEDYEGFVVMDSKGNNHAQLIDGVTWVKNPNPKGSTITLYLNGLAVEGELVPDATVTALAPSENQFMIGASNPTALAQYFQGELEEVRIWQVARTPEQILDNLFQRVLGDRGQLIAHYTFDAETIDANGRGTLRDHSFRGNDLTVPKASYIYSTAPIGDDIPLARNALAGFRTVFHGLVQSAPSATEYGDLQYSNDGSMFGVLKRCYSFIYQGQWYLITGFKVGNLVAQWLGQVQFEPQIKGFIEGAPPVPSENLTDTGYNVGEVDDYTDASVVELTQANAKTYTYSIDREHGFNTTFDLAAKGFLQLGDMEEGTGGKFTLGARFNLEHSTSFLDEVSTESQISTHKSTQMQLRGYFENPGEQGSGIRYAIGRRFVPENTGMALVESETADIFALRLEHNQALVSYQMRPNPDIPKDWNIIIFPMNPFYTKQGTLDGKVGNEADEDYPNAFTASPNSSYFKPIEAYALKNRINREEEELQAYYTQYGAQSLGVSGGGSNFAADKNLSHLKQQLPRVGKRNLVNTYVWTADGGLFAETQETLDVLQESTGGAYNFIAMGGVTFALEGVTGLGKIARIGGGLELEAMWGGHFNLTTSKGFESQEGFTLTVALDKVEGAIYERIDDDSPNARNVVMENGKPKKKAGKVDAYRFMSFYLEPRSEHHDLFFNQVVDQRWLRQSNDPNAKALLEAEQSEPKPPCWRIMHRVTYVSRVLPEFDQAAPLEKAMKTLDIESNYELVKTLDPFIRNKTNSFVEFAEAVREAIAQHLPELQPHTVEILQWLTLYYGVVDDTRLADGTVSEVDLPNRGSNMPPRADAGPDLTVKTGDIVTLRGAVQDVPLSAEDLFVTWSLTEGEDVVITHPHRLEAAVQFRQKGLYCFTLTASDGYLTGKDEVAVTVNQPLRILAGSSRILRSSERITTLAGEILDDGLGDPLSTELNIEWSVDEGSPVIFDDLQVLNTRVTFTENGRYVLRLTVSNGSFTASDTVVFEVGLRSAQNLLALYLFGEGSGTLVQDVSGTEPPLDLAIQTPETTAWSWSAGKLTLQDRTFLTSTLSTEALVQAFQDTDEITVEAWVQPSALPSGLARIVTLSNGPGDRNMTLGQTGNTYQFCLRTTETNANASTQVLAGTAPAGDAEVQVVCTRDASGMAWLYINGQLVSQRPISGTLAAWEPNFPLALGDEVNNPDDTHPRAWLGTFNLVALYNRALTPQEVADHYALSSSPFVPPVVDVGGDRTLTLPNSLTLSGTVRHEQFLTGTVQTTWVQLSGPNTARVATPNALSTTVIFSELGIYEFKLMAQRDRQIASDKLRVVVNQVPSINVTVLVNNRSVPSHQIPPLKPSDSVQVIGEVRQSGLGDPENSSVTTLWKTAARRVTIATPQALTTTLQFSEAGRHAVTWEVTTRLGAQEVATASRLLAFTVDALPTLQVTTPAVITLATPTPIQVALDLQGVISTTVSAFQYQVRQWQGPEQGIQQVTFPPHPSPTPTNAQQTLDNFEFTFQKSGVYEIEVSASNGYLTASQRFTVVANAIPVVNAGGDRTIFLPATVMLDGIVSDDGLPNPPGKVALVWSHTSGGMGSVTFSAPTSDYTEASFSAKGRYRIAFSASDGHDTGKDELDVVVSTAPTIQLTAPPIVTLPADGVLTGQVLDDGRGDPSVGTLTATWGQVQGPEVAQIDDISSDPMTPTARVTFANGGRYTFQLTVQLTVGDESVSTRTTVTVLANEAPIVAAGEDQVVNLVDGAYLQGHVQDDLLPEETTVEWSQVSPAEPLVQFGDARSLTTTVSFPAIGVYVLRLTGSDGAATAFDELTVLVNQAPVIEASAPALINIPGTATLTGQVLEEGRGDPTQGSITAIWKQVSGPAPAAIAHADSLTTVVTFTHSGEYSFQLTVNNGFLSTSTLVRVVANQAPEVEAGDDQQVNLPGTITLQGAVEDDGWPNPPAAVTVAWSKVSGPGEVMFGEQALETTASFSQSGIYTLRLTATDGAIATYDDLTVIANQPPLVEAGADQKLSFTKTVTLSGIVTDDQLPLEPGFVTTEWSFVSGPGDVTFENPTALITKATFSHPGSYVLQLTANDGAAIAQDEVRITLTARVTDGLIALYTFEEGNGLVVRDRSGVGEPMDLYINDSDVNKILWLPSGGLKILPTTPVNAAARIQTQGAAHKVIQAIKASNQITVEAWYRPASERPIYGNANPIRILSISASGSAAHKNRNFTLQQGQWTSTQASFYHARIRTSSSETSDEEGLQTQPNIIQPHITPEGDTSFKLNHVVYTWDGQGTGRLYVDGVLVKAEVFSTPRDGWGRSCANWNDSYAMAIARDPSGTWPGRGTFHLVAIYKRALTPEEVAQNYEEGI